MAEQNRTGEEEIRAKADCDVLWRVNRKCNFDCDYCFRDVINTDEDKRTEDPLCGKYSPEHIAKSFDDTGRIWHISMTGGEPFLYPRFMELVNALTRKHYLAVSTNLSLSSAYDFADVINPGRVTTIKANVHIMEREKVNGGVKEFLRKFLHFQNRGFDIQLVYVTYPPVLGRIREDLLRFRGEGVRRVWVKIFQGRYQDKRYPRDYSQQQQELIRGLGLNHFEEQILSCRVSFIGKKCEAGRRVFSMDIAGNVSRCSALAEGYGNLFEGTFIPGKSARLCSAKKCGCSYQGIRYALDSGSLSPSKFVIRTVQMAITAGESIGVLARR
ncbi:MAG: radical SAM protein [Sedimentisphaerales bacterium]